MAANIITLTGTLNQAPTVVVAAQTTIPSTVRQIPLVTNPNPKQSAKCANGNKFVNSPSSFQTLSGVGATDDVTTADFLWLKADAAIQLQLTQQNLNGGANITQIVNVLGNFMCEFPTGGLLLGVAIQGSANVEYLASGPT